MSDILPKLPVPPQKRPIKPENVNRPLDDFAEGFAGTLVLGSQALSGIAPHLTRGITENIAGPAVSLATKPIFTYSFPKPGLAALPAPFGFVNPGLYDLEPNYLNMLANPNTTLLGVGNPFTRFIPESYYFHTLPDTDPSTQYDRFILEGRRQRRTLETLTPNATLDELVALYTRATGPNAAQSFYTPEDIANSLEASIKARVGLIAGERIIMRATGRLPPDGFSTEPVLPIPVLSGGFPSPSNSTTVNRFGEINDIFSDIERAGVTRPRLGPPTLNAQQEASDRAPPLLRELASERADP